MNGWRLLWRALVVLLLALSVGACGAAPNQASSPSFTPAPSTSVPATEAIAPTSLALASPSVAAHTPTEQRSEPAAISAPSATIPLESTPTTTVQLDNATLMKQVYQHVEAGMPIVEIADPQLPLPDDIYPGQIKKYFQLGEFSFGLVLRSSMNFMLDLADDQQPSFSGLLVSAAGVPWRKYLEIWDAQPTDKNNPYYLWAQDGRLYLSVVDQLGAGSGEGIMKLVQLSATGSWKIVDCYYFGGGYSDPVRDGDYFAFSQYLDRHSKESGALCQNVEIALLP